MKRRGGFATLLVLWVVAIAAVTLTVLNRASYSQAAAGRDALARVRSYWAARAGVEATIARLEYGTQNPDTTDAFSILDDMAEVAEGNLQGTIYRVGFTENGKFVPGPMDAHARININRMSREALMTLRININRMSREALMTLPYITEDTADAIIDWIDPDDDTSPLGAEVGYYLGQTYPYEPRNGFIRSLQELELIAGVYPEYVREEDLNLNGLLDPEENDGRTSLPRDNADGKLDAGWSAIITTLSTDDVLTPSGQERLDLTTASEGDLATRAKLDRDQAKTIIDYVAGVSTAAITDFIGNNLQNLVRRIPGVTQDQIRAAGANLSEEQLGLLLDECSIGPAEETAGLPGRLNINTCPAEVLEYLPEISATLADSIILERSSRPQGLQSLVELLQVPGMSRRTLSSMYPLLTTRSNVYVVTSRGRDIRTGIETEIVATVDRSTVPVVIQELLVR
jgi:DNA uptake protein ComE-like DNA-binding protein